MINLPVGILQTQFPSNQTAAELGSTSVTTHKPSKTCLCGHDCDLCLEFELGGPFGGQL